MTTLVGVEARAAGLQGGDCRARKEVATRERVKRTQSAGCECLGRNKKEAS